MGYQPGVKTILFYIKCSTNLCKTFRSIKEIATDTSAVISTKTFLMMKPFGILLRVLTSVYFHYGGETKFKRFLSSQGFEIYTGLYYSL